MWLSLKSPGQAVTAVLGNSFYWSIGCVPVSRDCRGTATSFSMAAPCILKSWPGPRGTNKVCFHKLYELFAAALFAIPPLWSFTRSLTRN